MIRMILIVLTSFLFAGCGESADTKLSKNITYTVIEDSHLKNIKRSVNIVLDEKISEEDLRKLAHKIKKSDRTKYQRTFIGYYTRGGEDGGYWATTNFNPDLEVRVIGSTKDQDERLLEPTPPSPDKEILGVWLDNRVLFESKLTLYHSKEGTLYLERKMAAGGKPERTEVVYSTVGRKGKIDSKGRDPFADYYLINNADQLEFWGEKGNFYTAQSIKQ